MQSRKYRAPSIVEYVPNSYEQLEHAIRPADQGFPTAIHDAVCKGFGTGGACAFLLCLLAEFGTGAAIHLIHISHLPTSLRDHLDLHGRIS